MALPEVDSETYPTPDELHAQLLSHVRWGYANAGLTANVKPKSELWIRLRAVAQVASLAIANGKLRLEDTNFLTVTGDSLRALCAIFGVTDRAASASVGWVLAKVLSGATVTIPIAFRCTSATGVVFETTAGFTVVDGGSVKLQAVDTGTRGNLDAGAILTWNSAGIGYLAQKATAAAGGIDGGAPADTDDTLRARLLRRLRFPPVGGNWSYVAQLAEDASASVAAAFVYPTLRGPSSYDVAVIGASDNLVLGVDVVDVVDGAVLADMPGCEDLNATAIVEQTIDVVLNVSLPLPTFAGGAGGGWLDDEPWPSTAETAPNVFAKVTAVAANIITVDSTTPDAPTAGKRVSLWSIAGATMTTYAISSVGGVSGAYTVTLDAPGGADVCPVGTFVSAAAERIGEYATAFVAAMRALGPGEKTDNPDILTYARRKPGQDVEFPWALTSRQLSAIEGDFAEVADLTYAGRFDAGTFTTRTSPAIPPNTADPPRMLAPYRLSFRRQT